MPVDQDGAGAVTALGELWLESYFGDPAADGGSDVVCSPAGLWLALDALEPGADGALGGLGRGGAFVAEARRDTDAVLVGTVALEAEWERPFDPLFTRELPFTDARGVAHKVPAMVAEVPVEDAWTIARPQGKSMVVELRARPAGGGAAVRVRFALGENRQVPPAEVLAAAWAPAALGKALRGSRATGRPEAVLLELPRLTLSGELDSSPHLTALGLERVVQSCLVRFGERGMSSTAPEAPAENPADGSWFDGPGQLLRTTPVRLDRPFAVAVLDETGTVPLLGAYRAGRP